MTTCAYCGEDHPVDDEYPWRCPEITCCNCDAAPTVETNGLSPRFCDECDVANRKHKAWLKRAAEREEI